MPQSEGHKLGQMVGEWFEKTVVLKILDSVVSHQLTRLAGSVYLDKIGPRGVRHGKKKIVWKDDNGATHDLDYVLEIGGTDQSEGYPIAFVEAAWRRYTKHSKAKAQEIQGAVLPVVECENHTLIPPFLGAVICGEWTKPSIDQLEGVGFEVLRFTEREIFDLFSNHDIDIEWEETTPTDSMIGKRESFEELEPDTLDELANQFLRDHSDAIDEFQGNLVASIERKVTNCSLAGGETKKINLRNVGGKLRHQFLSVDLTNAQLQPCDWSIKVEYTYGRTGTALASDRAGILSCIQRIEHILR